jgi:hypothetical protein
MRSYSETDVFPRPILELFTMAHFAVSGLPDCDAAHELLRCHEVARIIERRLRRQLDKHGYLIIEEKAAPPLKLHIEVVDGHYHHIEHSWLIVGLHAPTYILDVYAVGRMPQVQLLTPDLGHAALFRPGPWRTDIRRDVVEALTSV